jgi:hypothetical protein
MRMRLGGEERKGKRPRGRRRKEEEEKGCAMEMSRLTCRRAYFAANSDDALDALDAGLDSSLLLMMMLE